MPIVNYVVEHVRFIEYATDEMLSMSERLLWYALMDVMNHRAQGNIWPEEFIRIDNVTLCRKAGIKFDALSDARNKLKQRGIIDFIPGERNKKNPMYKMTYFYPQFAKSETENDVHDLGGGHRLPASWQLPDPLPSPAGYPGKPDKNTGYPVKPDNKADKNGGYPVKPDYSPYNRAGNSPSNRAGNSPSNRPNIYTKLYGETYTETGYSEDVEDDEEAASSAYAHEAEPEEDPIPHRPQRMMALQSAYSRAFGKLASPAELERLLTFCHISGMPDQMAAKAMEIAAGNGPKNAIGYTLTILQDWKEHHVFQPHQIGEYQVERDKRENRGMLWGSGDVLEDYQAEQEARERRLRENIDEGLEEGAAQ